MVFFLADFVDNICNETDTLIKCNEGSKMSIIGASYGPRTSKTCGAPITEGWEKECEVYSRDDLEVIKSLCNTKASCSVAGWSKPEYDPCKGTPKYLKLQYSCKA